MQILDSVKTSGLRDSGKCMKQRAGRLVMLEGNQLCNLELLCVLRM